MKYVKATKKFEWHNRDVNVDDVLNLHDDEADELIESGKAVEVDLEPDFPPPPEEDDEFPK